MLFKVVFCFIIMDFCTGLLSAFKNKNYSSTIMREGLYHKCGSTLAVLFGVMVDYAQSIVDLGVNIPVTEAICTYIILMEVGSIIENIGKLNPDILPDKIRGYFSKLSGKVD